MSPLKAAIDQQELCERVIIQQHNRQLKQELESTRRDGYAMKNALESTRNDGYFYEMLLDSASNYLDTKITTFEENLTQSRGVIGRLQKENGELKRKLAKKTEKMRYLETKLSSQSLDSRIEDSLSHEDITTANNNNDSQIMFSIPEGKEEEDFGELQRPTCSTPQPPLQDPHTCMKLYMIFLNVPICVCMYMCMTQGHLFKQDTFINLEYCTKLLLCTYATVTTSEC